MLDRSEASLLRAAFVVRALTIIGLFLFHGLQQSFDTSSLLLLAPHAALAPLVRWDTLYFLAAASPTALPSLVQGDAEKLSGGYAYEQVLAFQPGLVALLRAAGYAWTDGWSVNAAILGGTVAATLASIIAPLLLFRYASGTLRSQNFRKKFRPLIIKKKN